MHRHGSKLGAGGVAVCCHESYRHEIVADGKTGAATMDDGCPLMQGKDR